MYTGTSPICSLLGVGRRWVALAILVTRGRIARLVLTHLLLMNHLGSKSSSVVPGGGGRRRHDRIRTPHADVDASRARRAGASRSVVVDGGSGGALSPSRWTGGARGGYEYVFNS